MKTPRFIDIRLQQRFCKKEARCRFPDKTTRYGPFRGMIYPDYTSVGSTLFPKLLGSYERELHPVMEGICDRAYSEVVDVGCAEGYYAVGLAIRIWGAQVYAYDTSERARKQCARMAEINGVESRVDIRASCNPQALANLNLTDRALIVSDCEGYEKDLFTPDTVKLLERHDVLIETHDLFDDSITPTLRQRFAATHDLQVISSIDDLQKALLYEYIELETYNLDQKRRLLAERRRSIMEWFFFTPKSSRADNA